MIALKWKMNVDTAATVSGSVRLLQPHEIHFKRGNKKKKVEIACHRVKTAALSKASTVA